jgi:hypothetical protein
LGIRNFEPITGIALRIGYVRVSTREPKLIRHGYGTKAVAELLSISPASARRLVRGLLPPGRTQELHAQMLKAGVPL